MRKWASSSPVSAGLALVVAGFIALFLAWNGAAGLDHVEGQIPYLLSGGLVGVGLIGAGLTVVNVQSRRQDHAELLGKLEELVEALRDDDGRQTPPAPRGTRDAPLRAAPEGRRTA
ncbi:MAG: hypothetical protein Q8K58_07320 [Acidimicrobiales bacterium]|nr:hypothetical protein [Acidimicrobiales bacterium]